MEEKKAALEAALFVAEEALDTDAIADVLNLGSPGYVQMILDQMQEDLESEERGLEIIEEDGGYRLQVKKQYVEQVKHLAPHQDLSDASLRTLSLIAYNAPVKQKKIIDIRGNRAYTQIRDLKSRGFLSSEKEGRTNVLDVTQDFLDYFGLDNIEEFRMRAESSPASELLEDDEEAEEEEDKGEPEEAGRAEEGDEDSENGQPEEKIEQPAE